MEISDSVVKNANVGDAIVKDGSKIKLENKVLELEKISTMSFKELEKARDEMYNIYNSRNFGYRQLNAMVQLVLEIEERK